MKISKCLFSKFGVFLLSASILNAEEVNVAISAEISQDDVDTQVEVSTPVQSASEKFDEWEAEMREKFNITENEGKNGITFIFEKASVNATMGDRRFGQALQQAFERAFANGQKKLLVSLYGKLITEKQGLLFQDESSDAMEFPEEGNSPDSLDRKVERIADKTLSLAEAKLDKELEEMGVEPEKYEKSTPEQKKTLFVDAFYREILTKACGSIAGLVPVQTTVKQDANGNACVGVMFIYSDKTRQVAEDIRLHRPSVVAGKGRNLLKTFIPKTNDEWIGQLGVRLAYDEDGSPAFVSYGLASFVPRNTSADDSRRDNIFGLAQQVADAWLIDTIAGSMSLTDSSTIGSKLEECAKKKKQEGAMVNTEATFDIIQVMRNEYKAVAKGSLRGIKTLGKKVVKLPTGQELIFCVRAFTYKGLEDANRAVNKNYAAEKAQEKEKAKKYNSKDYDGLQTNSLDDF